MVTRRQRTAQAEATGQPEPHSSLPGSTRRQARLPKGHGAPQAAAVGATPGIPDVNLSTAQPNQVVLYEDVETAQGLPESQILRGHGPSLRPKMTLDIPLYKPGTTGENKWARYTQMLEFYMETIFEGTEFKLTSPTQKYTPQQDKKLWKVLCAGVTDIQWDTLQARCKDKGAVGFRLLDKQIRGDLYKRKAEVQYNKDNLRFTEDMDVDSYSNKLHKLYNDLIELGLETAEKCALNLITTQVNRLPTRFEFFSREQQRIYLRWEKDAPPPLIDDFVQELASEETILRLNKLERSRAPAVHAAVANTPGGVPATTTPATTPVANPPPVQENYTPTPAQRPPPGPGASGRGRTNFNASAKRREWQRPYPKKNYNPKSTYNSNYNADYNSNTRSNGYYPDKYHSYGKPTCSKCGKSGRGHTAYECWQPDCTRCKTSAHTLAYCPKA